MARIYLDHTATTPLDGRVLEAMTPYFSAVFGNASSPHAFGREAKQALEHARATLAALISAEPGEVFFTSGGTEADNLAIVGVVAAARGDRNAVITSQAEHHAVLEPCEQLEQAGRDVRVVKVDGYGSVEIGALQEVLSPRTLLVSVMHANNEVGTISPVREIASLTHASGALFHTDAVQSAGKIPLDVRELDVDLMTISAHKLYGPKGIGALYVKRGTPIDPILHGGGQERGRRPGTENVPLAVGFAEALRIACEEREKESLRLRALRDALQAQITESMPGVLVNGHPTERLPHILNISFDSAVFHLEGDMLVPNMDLEGIALTSGSACTSGSMQPSHVLRAMGRDIETARATLRFSFGRSNTEQDVPEVVRRLLSVIERMRK